VERLGWFLAANQARLLRDLLAVVDLRNINHENICCLNTAVMVAIFAHRRRQLPALLDELRRMNDEDKETKRRALEAASRGDSVDRAFARAMRSLDYDKQRETQPSMTTMMPPPLPSYARIGSIGNSGSAGGIGGTASQGEGETGGVVPMIGDRADAMRNFREVLWFWTEYYMHRGRDRLSLEFSSHLRFQEWQHVVSLLSSDDGSGSSLLRSPTRLPRSPYQRSARVQAEGGGPLRGI
jgi:cell division protein FtsL